MEKPGQLTSAGYNKKWYKDKTYIIVICAFAIGGVFFLVNNNIEKSHVNEGTIQSILINTSNTTAHGITNISVGLSNISKQLDQDIALREEANDKLDASNTELNNLTKILGNPNRFTPIKNAVTQAVVNGDQMMQQEHLKILALIENLTNKSIR